jgi:hypothetical protein
MRVEAISIIACYCSNVGRTYGTLSGTAIASSEHPDIYLDIHH